MTGPIRAGGVLGDDVRTDQVGTDQVGTDRVGTDDLLPDHMFADHLRVDLDDGTRTALRSCADVLYGTGSPELAAPLLRHYPGCLLVSLRDARGRCVTLARCGAPITLGPVRCGREHALLASMLHQWLIELGRGPAVPAGPPLNQSPGRTTGPPLNQSPAHAAGPRAAGRPSG